MNRYVEGDGPSFTMDPDDAEALQPHAAALVVPTMEDDEYEQLKQSIRLYGLLEPIVLHEGQVLDGRHRLQACLDVGAAAAFVDWEEPPDIPPILWVLATNAHRRHLSAAQRASLAARVLRDLVAEDERVPWVVPGCTPHDPHSTCTRAGTDEAHHSTNHVPAARRAAADALGVSPRAVAQAEHVHTWGDPELVEALNQGRVSLRTAEALADLPEERQREVLASGDQDRIRGVAEEQRLPRRTTTGRSCRSCGCTDDDHPAFGGSRPPFWWPETDLCSTCQRQQDEDEPAVPADLDEQRELLRRVDPKLLQQEAKRAKEERKAAQRQRQLERAREQAEQAAAAAPRFEGVEIRCCTAADLVAALEGAGVRLVHADPPWTYQNHGNGAAESHYATMSVDEILDDLEAAHEICADQAILVLWTTWPVMGELFAALANRASWPWGPPVTGGAWSKTGRIGNGHWWRGNSEPVLIFTRGKPAVLATITNSHISPRTAHSEKPEAWLRQILAAWCPRGGLVADLYAGHAPLARACVAEGRRYVGAEIDPVRHGEAMAALEGAAVDGELAGVAAELR